MNKNLFKCAETPYPVFGCDVPAVPFNHTDVDEVFHWSETDEEFVGVFKLSDGRYASVFHKKFPDFCIEDAVLGESVAHVAPSYEEIVRLGLTNSTRDVLGI